MQQESLKNKTIKGVLGRSDIFLYLEILKKAVGLLPIAIGIFFGIYYMLLVSIFTGIVSLYLNIWYTGKTLNYTFINQLRDIAPSCFTAIVIALAVCFFSFLVLPNYVILGL